MEANAYRFGNIVLFRNIKMPSGFLEGRIESIDKNHIKGVSIFNDSAELFSGVWEAKGIPLTEEWLLKMGFKKVVTPWQFMKGEDVHYENEHCWIYCKEKFFEFELNISDRRVNLFRSYHYVHQLQNLYFALTNTELTINL